VTTITPDVLPTYLRLRESQRSLNRALSKTLSRKAIETSAMRLGFFNDGVLIADTESDLDLVNDVAIYDYYPSGDKNAVARYGAQHKVEGDTALVLDAMRRAQFTLIELGERVDGVGLHVHDLVADDRFFLADVGLSQTGVPGLILATRILKFDSFAMTRVCTSFSTLGSRPS
jgi:hypothetical protein